MIKKRQYKLYPSVKKDLEDWPIYHLSKDRTNFVKEVETFTFNRTKEMFKNKLEDSLASTMYQERIRLKEEPWKVDPPNEKLFWNKIRKLLVKNSFFNDKKEINNNNEEILQRIIHRYSEEIVGTFNIPTFKFARRFLTFFFNRLLNTASRNGLSGIFSSKFQLYERLKIHGDIETIQKLFDKGTVIVVPTHISNLDSIMIGYTMDAILGLPSFSYGAGLNLYNSGIAAYFMNRLGAYRVDRRKKNAIYLETLKAMSNLSIQRGTNSLFFPGGTRSRSGTIENKLKMGLLGTCVEAQRSLCQQGKSEKVFIVPLIVSYHFVLEAAFLIEQHLKYTGKEHYFKGKDESTSIREWLKFGWQFFSQNSDIVMSFAKPFDVLGNFVDENGTSYDKFGKPIDIKDYFTNNGVINQDLQRESEYTKILADRIVERYYKDNIVLSSHVVAYAAFNMLLHHNENLDLFAVMRLPTDDFYFQKENFIACVADLQQVLQQMELNDNIKLSEQIHWEPEKLVNDGIKNLGFYHIKKPLLFDKKGNICSDDFDVLYFYHNRLQNYGISKKIKWEKYSMMLEE